MKTISLTFRIAIGLFLISGIALAQESNSSSKKQDRKQTQTQVAEKDQNQVKTQTATQEKAAVKEQKQLKEKEAVKRLAEKDEVSKAEFMATAIRKEIYRRTSK